MQTPSLACPRVAVLNTPDGNLSRLVVRQHLDHLQRPLLASSKVSTGPRETLCSATVHPLGLVAISVGRNITVWLPALSGLWLLSQAAGQLRKWYRAFAKCRILPATSDSRSLLRPKGDLNYGLSPQIHRKFTALAERLGGVYYSRVLWAQAWATDTPTQILVPIWVNQMLILVSYGTGGGGIRSLRDCPSSVQQQFRQACKLWISKLRSGRLRELSSSACNRCL